MAVSDDLSAHVAQVTRRLRNVRAEAARPGADLVRKELLAEVKSIGRGTFRGGKLGISVRVLTGGEAVGRAGRSAGAWAIVDGGAKAHDIGPRRGKGLRFADGGMRKRPVKHPGIDPTGVWDRAHDRAKPKADALVEDLFDEAMAAEFG